MKLNKKILLLLIGIIIVSILIIGYKKLTEKDSVPSDIIEVEKINVDIDVSKNLGEISEVFGAGLMGSWWNDFLPMETEVKSLHQKPFWRLHLGLGVDVPGGSDETKSEKFEENFRNWLKEEADPKIKQYQDNGHKVIITLAQVPKWLSLYPSNELLPSSDIAFAKSFFSPPRDYAAWKKLIQLLIKTQAEDGIRADYIIGDEPNWMFYGTEEQFFQYYAETAKAIKEVDSNIKIGAPGAGSWAIKKNSNCPKEKTGSWKEGRCPKQDHTIIEGLITYVSKNNTPLDFIDWHFPNHSSQIFQSQINLTRQHLKNNGLDENMPLTIGEWVFSSKGEEESTEKASAYTISLLKTLADNKVSRHSATSTYDQSGWKSGDWQHVGFFSLDGIIKPKWNSFKVIDKLANGSTLIEANAFPKNGPTVAVSSESRDKNKISVLLSDFMLQYSTAKSRQVSLNIKNIPFSGKANLTTYIIDKDHSNSCRYNKKTEEKPTDTECGINGAVDKAVAQAKTEARAKALPEAAGYLETKGYTKQQINEFRSQLLDACLKEENSQKCFVAKKQNICSEYPEFKCDVLRQDLLDSYKIYEEAYKNLYYRGKHVDTKGKNLTTTVWADKINSDPNISLEGSKQTREINIENGEYSEAINLHQYGAMLIEITRP